MSEMEQFTKLHKWLMMRNADLGQGIQREIKAMAVYMPDHAQLVSNVAEKVARQNENMDVLKVVDRLIKEMADGI